MIDKYIIINTIAQQKNVTKSAEILHMTQSGVSHVVNNIEKEWGFSLFHRSKQGMRLTKNGEYLLTFMNEVLNSNQRLLQEVKLLNGLNYGQITVGTFPSITTRWIPKIINCMNQKYPDIEIDLIEENYENLEELVLSGDIDCAFISDKPNSHRIKFIPIYEDPFYCLVNKQHIICEKDTFPLEEISEFPFILPGKGGAVELNKFFKNNNIRPNIKYEIMDINQSIIAMIENDLGISILPSLLIGDTIPESIKKMKLNTNFTRDIGIIYQNNLSPAAKKFIEISEEVIYDITDTSI